VAQATFCAAPEVARYEFIGSKTVLGCKRLQKSAQSFNGDVVCRDNRVEDLSTAIEALNLPRAASAVFHDA
jgi:hypothetical protein